MFPRTISHTAPYGIVASVPCCLPYQFVSAKNVGWTVLCFLAFNLSSLCFHKYWYRKYAQSVGE